MDNKKEEKNESMQRQTMIRKKFLGAAFTGPFVQDDDDDDSTFLKSGRTTSAASLDADLKSFLIFFLSSNVSLRATNVSNESIQSVKFLFTFLRL